MAQVIEHKITAAEKDVIKQELEATVGMQLDHPNVVHTLKHTTRVMSQVRCAERAAAGAAILGSPACVAGYQRCFGLLAKHGRCTRAHVAAFGQALECTRHREIAS